MKITLKKLCIALTILFISILVNSAVYAANLNVHVNCNGKTIKMTSETPDMTWKIDNLLPGHTDESTLTIENVGTKKVDVDMNVKIESGKDLTDILDLKIIKVQSNTSAEEELYSGKYSDLKSVGVNLESNQTETYKFVVALPTETGNEYQGKECVVKIGLVASGEEDKPQVPDEGRITTDEVVPPQTGEGIILYVVGGILLVALIVFLITFFINKKEDKE